MITQATAGHRGFQCSNQYAINKDYFSKSGEHTLSNSAVRQWSRAAIGPKDWANYTLASRERATPNRLNEGGNNLANETVYLWWRIAQWCLPIRVWTMWCTGKTGHATKRPIYSNLKICIVNITDAHILFALVPIKLCKLLERWITALENKCYKYWKNEMKVWLK